MPGSAVIVSKSGNVWVGDVLGEKENRRCSFERIYFSRGSDADIYKERKALGRNLIDKILCVAFIGMIEGLEKYLDVSKATHIEELSVEGALTHDVLMEIMSRKLRIEKVAIKDIKLRTFIAEGESRNDLAAHVYDVTYGIVENGRDTLVVIDDSIVRGTTLRQSIIRMLDRLHPKKIVVVSSSPQVRYPDYYGIDMSRMGEFCAFRAAVSLLKKRGMEHVLEQVYEDCLMMEKMPDDELRNCVKAIYAPCTGLSGRLVFFRRLSYTRRHPAC